MLDIAHIARRLHALGANVVPVNNDKIPTCSWKKHQSERQSETDVEALDWRSPEVVAVSIINGINGWRSIDIDARLDERGAKLAVPETVLQAWLEAMGLPPNYAWAWRSLSGAGWHIHVRCTGGTITREEYYPLDADSCKQVELRWRNHQTVIPPHAAIPATPPAVVEWAAVQRAVNALCRVHQLKTANRNGRAPDSARLADAHPIHPQLIALARTVATAPEGSRNTTLNKAAFEAGRRVAEGIIDEDETRRALAHAALLSGLDAREIEATLTSGLDAGIAKGSEPRLTDAGNAELFADAYANRFRYDHTIERWRVWDGARWRVDDVREAETAFIDLVRRQYHTAVLIGDLEARAKAAKWYVQSESAQKVAAALSLARSHPRLATTVRDYDADPARIATPNGWLIDLRTGEARRTTPDDRVTLVIGADYDPTAACPRWLAFLRDVTCEDNELAAYIQRAVGYTLTGETDEQAFFLCHGDGANGKSTMLDLIADLLGDYAGSMAWATIDADERHKAPYELATLHGKRYVSVIETDEDRRLNEARIKAVTGQDIISARHPYGRPFTYRPAWKLWMAMNHLPRILGVDTGIWRRIRAIPFRASFAGRADPHLKRVLKQELPGILNWAIEGARAWYESGLGRCRAVDEYTEAYRKQANPVAQWVDETLTPARGASVPVRDAYELYREWCQQSGEYTLSMTAWRKRLTALGIEGGRTERSRFLIDVRIRTPKDLVIPPPSDLEPMPKPKSPDLEPMPEPEPPAPEPNNVDLEPKPEPKPPRAQRPMPTPRPMPQTENAPELVHANGATTPVHAVMPRPMPTPRPMPPIELPPMPTNARNDDDLPEEHQPNYSVAAATAVVWWHERMQRSRYALVRCTAVGGIDPTGLWVQLVDKDDRAPVSPILRNLQGRELVIEALRHCSAEE